MPTAARNASSVILEPVVGNTYKITYKPFGAAKELFESHHPETILVGAAGTGKSMGCLQYLNAICGLQRYAGLRCLMVRKNLSSLTATGIKDMCEQVLAEVEGVRFFGGSRTRPAEFTYPNGSVIIVGGMDKSSKIMGGNYDCIYTQETTELSKDNWESLLTRARRGHKGFISRVIGDANPDAPTHWLYQRWQEGHCLFLKSVHQDNPVLWNREAGEWTEQGRAYMKVLESLTGVRRKRLFLGEWAAAEGLVYENFDPAVHIISREHFERIVQPTWGRYWGVDFGYTHPFVWGNFARDHDGRLYLYREIYMTQRLVQDHAKYMRQLTRDDPGVNAVLCDHDAEDRHTLELHGHVITLPAYKDISMGIQAVEDHLRIQGDGKPRLYIVQDSLVEMDQGLKKMARPTRTAEEFPTYVWDSNRMGIKETPVDKDNHGLDMCRYVCAYNNGLVLDPGKPRSVLAQGRTKGWTIRGHR